MERMIAFVISPRRSHPKLNVERMIFHQESIKGLILFHVSNSLILNKAPYIRNHCWINLKFECVASSKGKTVVVSDEVEDKLDFIDPEDAHIILEEEDLTRKY